MPGKRLAVEGDGVLDGLSGVDEVDRSMKPSLLLE
jgi:hypothetical protein